MSTLPILF